MCRFQHILYICGCTSPLPIFMDCPPDRCPGAYIDRTPKPMNHPCAACAHRSQTQSQNTSAVFDDGSCAARRDSVRRWESSRREQPAVEYINGMRRPSGFTRYVGNESGESRDRSASADRQPAARHRTRMASPPPARRNGQRRRGSSADDEMMQDSSEEGEYIMRYDQNSGGRSRAASPRRRSYRRYRR